MVLNIADCSVVRLEYRLKVSQDAEPFKPGDAFEMACYSLITLEYWGHQVGDGLEMAGYLVQAQVADCWGHLGAELLGQ